MLCKLILNIDNFFIGSRKKDQSSHKLLPNVRQRNFSPEVNQQRSYLESGFPFNMDKIFRKHAEQEEKRQKLRYD